MKNIIRTYDQMVKFSKHTPNKIYIYIYRSSELLRLLRIIFEVKTIEFY